MSELFLIVEGINEGKKENDRIQWNHTAHLMCMYANSKRDPKKKRQPWKVRDFNPYEISVNRERDEIVEVDASALKDLYKGDHVSLKKKIAEGWDKKDAAFFAKVKARKILKGEM